MEDGRWRHGQRTMDNGQWTTDHGLRTTDHGPRTSRFQLLSAIFDLQSSIFNIRSPTFEVLSGQRPVCGEEKSSTTHPGVCAVSHIVWHSEITDRRPRTTDDR